MGSWKRIDGVVLGGLNGIPKNFSDIPEDFEGLLACQLYYLESPGASRSSRCVIDVQCGFRSCLLVGVPGGRSP